MANISNDARARRAAWLLLARDDQLPPPLEDPWRAWFLRGGRGSGKTRCGAEVVAQHMRECGDIARVGIIVPTFADGRDTCVEGVSGLLSVFAPTELLNGSLEDGWHRTEGLLRLQNGARAKIFASGQPNRLRGPQHTMNWYEEISSWEYAIATYDMAELGLRLPSTWGPRAIITSTPKNNAITNKLVNDPLIMVVQASTYENRANLDPAFLRKVIDKYENTRLGLQELHGQVLKDVPGALWKSEWLRHVLDVDEFIEAHGGVKTARVGWDVAIRSKEKSDLHGIVAVLRLVDDTFLVKADRSQQGTPEQCCRVAIMLALEVGSPKIVIEDNQGGETWKSVWREACRGLGLDPFDPFTPKLDPKQAAVSKELRAQPVAQLYEVQHARSELDPLAQPRIAHTLGLDLLEDELTTWDPEQKAEKGALERDDPEWKSPSPNRLDALVWAMYGHGIGPNKNAGRQTRRAGRLSELLN